MNKSNKEFLKKLSKLMSHFDVYLYADAGELTITVYKDNSFGNSELFGEYVDANLIDKHILSREEDRISKESEQKILDEWNFPLRTDN